MAKVISVHEYSLKQGVHEADFRDAIDRAKELGLFQLPGLMDYYFVKGIKGIRQGQFSAIWIYESREFWEQLWGSPENPVGKEHYPKNWQIWEDEILAPLIEGDPDRIEYTTYAELTVE